MTLRKFAGLGALLSGLLHLSASSAAEEAATAWGRPALL